MDTKKNFIDFILKPQSRFGVSTQPKSEPAAEEGFDFLASPEPEPVDDLPEGTSFARYLLPHFFGTAGQAEVPLLGSSKALLSQVDGKGLAQVLPEEALLWDRRTSGQGPRYVILVEFPTIPGKELIRKAPTLFRTAGKLDQLEDVMDRIAATIQDGMAHRTQSRDSSSVVIDPQESLVVVSVRDDREEGEHRWLVTLSSRNECGGFESFRLQETVRGWERSLAEQHLGALYDRCFSKLNSEEWPQAFTTTEERTAAEAFVSACESGDAEPDLLKKEVVRLLDKIAMGFGLHNDLPVGGTDSEREATCLDVSELPLDHDIGADPAEKATAPGSPNPFTGITIRDRAKRLLGYIIYPLKDAEDAASLRKRLEKHNRFHNVLVVYPGPDGAEVELWQGRERLEGKLRKAQRYDGVARIVSMLSRFFIVSKAKVRNPKELAEELAYRAKFLRTVAHAQLKAEPDDGPLKTLYKAFQENLIRDQKPEEFADAFAQTITYGLLAARWLGATANPDSRERFTRATAEKYLVGTTPFLREMYHTTLNMQYGDQQARLLWLVDDIANLLDRVDVISVFKQVDRGSDSTTDPIIHFYEPFLEAYDKERKAEGGVFYTPRPVARFIVQASHALLANEFRLPLGLASTESWSEVLAKHHSWQSIHPNPPTGPFVTILDPAAGTGTFLCEVIDLIHATVKNRWDGAHDTTPWRDYWNSYVDDCLLPRVVGFELMIAPYAICHLKLVMKLAETGYDILRQPRLRVYLTDSLEPGSDIRNPTLDRTLPGMAQESLEVAKIKREHLFTVIVGNPPYLGEAGVGGVWMANLMRGQDTQSDKPVPSYFHVAGTPLGERNPKWLNDKYVKFLRLSQWHIARSGLGVVGIITNANYLDGQTFRGLREKLVDQFSAFDIIHLHGDPARKPKSVPMDQNVFRNITTDVAIFVGASYLSDTKHTMRRTDVYGTADEKEAILGNCASLLQWTSLQPSPNMYYFSIRDDANEEEYMSYARLDELMPVNSAGIVTARDDLSVAFSSEELWERILKFSVTPVEEARAHYLLGKDAQDWTISLAQKDLLDSGPSINLIRPLRYRPFDSRVTYWTGRSKGFHCRPRPEVMAHMVAGPNLAIHVCRQCISERWSHILVSDTLTDDCYVSNKSRERGFSFPLRLYKSKTRLVQDNSIGLNLSPLALKYMMDTNKSHMASMAHKDGINSNGVLFYVYAVLYSGEYRTRYLQFLKEGFPRIPFARDSGLFAALSSLGEELVALHLLKSSMVEAKMGKYVGGCAPLVEKIEYDIKNMQVLIGKAGKNYFDGVSSAVWGFCIGSYRVCHKWLDDRRKAGRTLSDEDIAHYQKIVVAISETIRIMGEIDEVIEEHGGWPGAFVTEKKQG